MDSHSGSREQKVEGSQDRASHAPPSIVPRDLENLEQQTATSSCELGGKQHRPVLSGSPLEKESETMGLLLRQLDGTVPMTTTAAAQTGHEETTISWSPRECDVRHHHLAHILPLVHPSTHRQQQSSEQHVLHTNLCRLQECRISSINHVPHRQCRWRF